MSVLLVQGDKGVALRGVIIDDDTGDPVNLTNCDVFFQMRKKDDHRYSINGDCTIINALGGVVRYVTGSNDLNTAGEYLGQFEVHYPDTSIQTTIVPVDISVRRQ